MTAVVVVGTVVAMVGLLAGCQRRLIYFPRHYPSNYTTMLPRNMAEISYETSQGRQTAFYIPPTAGNGGSPAPLWVLFGGNAASALGWLDWVERPEYGFAGYLLVDYPGYGVCQGKPSARTIQESSEAALAALAGHCGVQPSDLERRLSVLGHSMGVAAALQLAARHPVEKAILVSPFTSLSDMARRLVGWPLCHLLRDQYDNRARLKELAARASRPEVAIFHGDADEIVPVRMGRALAAMFPDWIVYHEMRGADHNGILDMESRKIREEMMK